MVSDRQLFVAGRHPPVLLEAVDEALYLVPLAVRHAVEERIGRVRRPMGDDITNAPAAQIAAHGPAAIAFVTRQAVGAQPRPTAAGSFDGAGLQEGRQGELL